MNRSSAHRYILLCIVLFGSLLAVLSACSPKSDESKKSEETSVESSNAGAAAETAVVPDCADTSAPTDSGLSAETQTASETTADNVAVGDIQSDQTAQADIAPVADGSLAQLRQDAEANPGDAAKSARYIEALLDNGQPAEARQFYRTLPFAVRSLPEIRPLFYRTFEQDERFPQEAQTVSGKDIDDISPLGGGTTLTFTFVKDGKKIGAFKPHQKRRNSNFRSEIAAWRLCEMLQCDFRIPRNQMVRVGKNEFNRLYNLSKSSKRESYRKGFDDLIWTTLSHNSYVYGTLKDWVPDFVSFPIEFVAMWRNWVSQANFMDTFPDLKDALAPIKKHDNIRSYYDALMAQAAGLTTKELANQISQMLTFDYLIGNWDRFSILIEQRGRNCQFKDGHLVSIDNGASFVKVDMKYIIVRFNYIERFNRRFVEEIRMLDKEETFRVLFPTQSRVDRANFSEFWDRRTQVLERIDALCAEYGEDKVLSL